MTRRTFRAAGVLAVVGVTALATGCAGAAAGESESTDGGTSALTIIHAPINYELPYIAEQEGYFDEVGLDVTIKAGGTPQDNLAQIMGGSANLTITAWDTVVTATAEGMPVLAVAGQGVVSSAYDTSGIIVRGDSGIESVADLSGKTIAYNDLGGGPHIVTQQAFEAAGLAADDFEAIKLPYASMQAALEGGQVDAVFPSDSFYEQISTVQENVVIANPTREFRAGLPITLWAGTQQWLDANPDTVHKFVEAMTKALAFYEDDSNHDAVLKIRQEVSGITVEQAAAMKTEFRIEIPNGVTQSVTDALVQFGAVENKEDVKTSKEVIWSEALTTD
ncbi:ABC transporter substrate-binding protein [Mycetocola zhadangensis]|nr:ABC transporter substrate-binding protein [Mycetocola zhadangensis]GGF00162.1 hypothetical protein GCM10011313_23880 [Mycetocola zhadangensis]